MATTKKKPASRTSAKSSSKASTTKPKAGTKAKAKPAASKAKPAASKGTAAKAKVKVSAALREMQQHWEQGKERAAGVPEGAYICRLSKVTFGAAKSSGNWGTTRVHTVLNGEHAGSEIRDRITLSTEQGPYFTAQFIEAMGYEVPESVEDFQDVFDAIVEEGAAYRASVTQSGDFFNVAIEELIEEEDLEELLEGELDEEEDEDEEGDEEDEDADEEEDEDEDEESDEEEEDEDADEDEDEEEEEADDEEEEEEDEETKSALLEIAESFDLEEVTDDLSIDDIVEVFNGVEWTPDMLDKTELKLFKSLGIEVGEAEAPKKGKAKSSSAKSTSTKTSAAKSKGAAKKGKQTGRSSKR